MKIILPKLLLLLALPLSAPALERLEPPEGCYFGVNIGQGDTIARLSTRLGLSPAVYVQFFHFPMNASVRDELVAFLEAVRPSGGMALITLEPFQGLDAITQADCQDLAGLCAANESQGMAGILIRFAHEMNGNWYPWCQQPAIYKTKFRLLAETVRAATTRTGLLWAPHNGIGYPFSTTGHYQARPGTADFTALDTDGNGVLTAHDDMYEPYYPGDDAVDWVGMTIYHWGRVYPWLENEMPPTNSFASTLTGGGHVPPIPDFYARYCADGVHNKPLAIPETAAFFNPHQPAGPGEFGIKQAWWRQVFNVSDEDTGNLNIATHFPKLKCINWFDHYKPEAEIQFDWVDWRISAHPVIREAFLHHLRAPRQGRPYFLTAQTMDCAQKSNCILDAALPRLVPLSGSVQVDLITRAQAPCELVVDLLDQNYQWQGGTRVAVAAGQQASTSFFTLHQPLVDGQTYRWSIFLTPTGGDHLAALDWYPAPGPVARAIVPSIEIVGYPPVFPAGSAVVVKVKYTSAAAYTVAQVNILDADYQWHGGGTVPVSRGEGWLDVLVTPQPGLAPGPYMLECFLSNSPENWEHPMARAANRDVQVAPAPAQDFMQSLPQRSIVAAGDVFRFLVTYAAPADRDLHVDLLDDQNHFLAGTVQRVGPSSGVQELALSYPGALPGIYRVNAFITEPGQIWTAALAWSQTREITVLPASYMEWAEWRWGNVLGNDAILPHQDADGDGASNDAERVAHTAPLHASDVLRLEMGTENGRPVLSWSSAWQRRYRLWSRPAVGSGEWTPPGDWILGTGNRLTVPINPTLVGPRAFYRLEVEEL